MGFGYGFGYGYVTQTHTQNPLFCGCNCMFTTASNFAFKINKGRKIKFNQRKDGNIISREITSNHTLSVSIFVKNFP